MPAKGNLNEVDLLSCLGDNDQLLVTMYATIRFGTLPHGLTFPAIKAEFMEELLGNLMKEGAIDIKSWYSINFHKKKPIEQTSTIIEFGRCILYYRGTSPILYYDPLRPQDKDELSKRIKHVFDINNVGKAYMLHKEYGELEAEPYDVKGKISDDYVDTHLNDNFKPVHEVIMDKLFNSDHGIVLLHGIPGTGKTTYIRFLIERTSCSYLIVPRGAAELLADPKAPKFLGDMGNVVVVLEDSEEFVACRDGRNNPVVANLLGMTDGLLNDVAQIRVIATFNCSINEVDPALMRPGRLVAEYKFGELEYRKADALRVKLGYAKTERPGTLAEIYNTPPPASIEKGHSGFVTRRVDG